MKFCARICLYLCVHTDRYIFACVCVCLCECVLEIVAMTKIIARFVNLSRCTRPIIQKSYIQLHIIIHKTWQFVKGKLTLNSWHCCHSTHKITAIATSFVGGFYSATAVEIATTTVSTTISFFLCLRCRPPSLGVDMVTNLLPLSKKSILLQHHYNLISIFLVSDTMRWQNNGGLTYLSIHYSCYLSFDGLTWPDYNYK